MYKKITIILMLFIYLYTNLYCNNLNVTNEMATEVELNEIVNELEKYTNSLDLNSISSNLMQGKGLEYNEIANTLFVGLKSEFSKYFKDIIFVLIFLVIISIVKSLELEKDSSISKAANIVTILVIIAIFLGIYLDVIILMKKTITIQSNIVQLVSPFMMGILILSGAITTSSLLEPIILLLVSVMGFCVNYVITPLISVSVVFNVVTNISDAVNLSKFSCFAKKTALWLNGIFLAIFLAVVGIQTTVSTSVDSVTLKTTQAALSGTIPVVR